jgi:hypothetical protein
MFIQDITSMFWTSMTTENSKTFKNFEIAHRTARTV